MKIDKEIVFGDVRLDQKEMEECISAGKMFYISKPYALYNSADGVSPMPYEEYAVYTQFDRLPINGSHVTWFNDLSKHKEISDAYMQLTTSIIQDTPKIIV